jgi:hypothetical protein
MAASSLTRTGETPPTVRKGHGASALGPSDSTDSGSDVRGGPGARRVESDSDRGGTGERASAGRDDTRPVDQTLYDNRGNTVEGSDIADDAALDTTLQESGDRADLEPTRRDAVDDVERGDVRDTSGGRRNEPV